MNTRVMLAYGAAGGDDEVAQVLCFSCKSQFIAKAHCPTYSGERRNAIRIGAAYEPSTSGAEKLSDAAAGWVYRGTLSHRRRHRTIGSILRNGLRRSHSEQRRQQRRAGVHPDREHVA